MAGHGSMTLGYAELYYLVRMRLHAWQLVPSGHVQPCPLEGDPIVAQFEQNLT